MNYSKLLVFIRPYKYLLAGSVGSLIAFTVMGMAMPWILKIIIDKALNAGGAGFLLAMLGVIVAVYFLRSLFMYISHYITFYTAQRILFDIRTKLFRHLQGLSLRFYHQYRTGKLITNILTDVAALQQMVSATLITLIVQMFTIACILIVLFALCPKMALFCCALFPLYYLNFNYFKNNINRDSRTLREMMSEISANLAETLNGVRIVKSFGKERTECREFVSSLRPAFDMSMSISMKGVYCWMFAEFVTMSCFLVSLGYGGVLVMRDEMTIGEFVAFYSYLCMVGGPVQAISGLSTVVSEGMTSGERILRILNAEPDVVEAENPLTLSSVKGHITFENVCFGYNGDDLKVKNFSLDIAPGRKVALVGPSGSGKSTIASLLLRFYDVSSGSIKVDGTDIRRLSISGYRGNIGVVLQESFLFSGTIEENIRYGRSDAPFEDVVKAAKMANAHDFISELPRGYQTEIGENGAMVSGGQKQRIAIARAVLRDPKILILDEATSALDTVSERTVQDALDKLMEGRTTIIVAHRLTTVQNADTIVVMRGGVIEQTGGHSKLMLEPGLYRELYSMQKRGSGKDGGSSGSGAVSNAA